MKIYKIRCKSDGLFSSGGMAPYWRKEGKSWKKGPLLSHLTMIRDHYMHRDRTPYHDAEIVEFEVREAGTLEIDDFTYASGKTVKEVADIEKIASTASHRRRLRRKEITG